MGMRIFWSMRRMLVGFRMLVLGDFTFLVLTYMGIICDTLSLYIFG